MKIAVPVTIDNRIDSHFGHCEYFNIYSVSGSKEIGEVKKIPSSNGCGCKSGIATVLSDEGVTVMLAGGIGGGAINVLNSNGIDVVRGCNGNPEQLVKLYIDGKLSDSGESCHQHEHHHQHGHSHGESHSCNK
jgi:predicted Fe-Mo cluster-binding NifX family protein